MKDLIILSADTSMKLVIEAILDRHKALGIREIPRSQRDVRAEIKRDPSVYLSGHEFLRTQARLYRYGILICDRHGSGQHRQSRIEMEAEMEGNLARSGWINRSAAIVIEPELEVWTWNGSPHVTRALGWEGEANMNAWLVEQGFLLDENGKPDKPQDAMERALRLKNIPKSSSIFVQIAQNVSLGKCVDPAFVKLRRKLIEWFPAE